MLTPLGVVNLSWTAPASSGITGYAISRNGAQLTTVSGASTTTYADTAAPQGQAVTYGVAATTSGPPSVTVTTSVLTETYRSAVLADGPIGFWPLGETSGTSAADASGNGKTGTYATWGSGGGYVDLPSGFANFTGGLTVNAWLDPAKVTPSARVLELAAGPNGEDAIVLDRYQSSNALALYICNASSCAAMATPSGPLSLNTWQMVTATETAGGTATLYFDGKAMATGTLPPPPNVTRTDNYIGRSAWASSDPPYVGSVSGVALFAKALTPAEVATLYAAG